MANEKRLDLIDREALIEKEKPMDSITHGMVMAVQSERILEAPTVDAEEVVHAKWEEIGVADYKCSRCGFRFTSADPISMFQYCRCGAKMDGDGNG